MHICHIITRLIIGGAQENTLLTCEGLHERGYQVTLMAGPTRGPEGSLVERARRGGYRYVEVPEMIRAINPWMDHAALRAMRYELSKLRPDVVHTHSSKAGIIGRFAARDARVPRIFHTIHGMSFNRTQPWLIQRLYAWMERRCARFTDRIITVADAMIDQSVAARVCARDKMITIYSGIEIKSFDPERYDRAAIRRELGFEPEHIVVATVARLFRKKGYEQLLPIMAEAAANNPAMRFLWVGDGAQRGEYEAELRRLNLHERTRLVGLVPPEAVAKHLAAADLAAHTSQWEGLPRVAVQALLMRVPVVAFAIDGTPEIVRSGETGECVPLGAQAEFVESLLKLAANPTLRDRYGAAGRALCAEQFDHERMIDRIEGVYRGALTGHALQF
jgi:glycosyltransferase involved in cell wall biosynthesis